MILLIATGAWLAQFPVGAIRGYEGRDLLRSGSRTGERDLSALVCCTTAMPNIQATGGLHNPYSR
jgi:hypothetical protein